MNQTINTRILVENVQGTVVVTFVDEMLVSEEVIHEVDEQLVNLLDELRSESVLLNFREVQAMSSSVLAILLKVARHLARTQGRLKLCSIAPDLRDIFRITRFDRLFEIHADELRALDSF